MRGVFLFGILIFLQSLSVFAQKNVLNLELKDNTYFIDSTRYTVVSVDIINCNKENLILWLDKLDVSELSVEQKLRRYFFKTRGDFSFAQLIYDNLEHNLPPIIFTSFVKKLKPQTKFSINILTKSFKGKERIRLYFNKHLVYLKESVLNKYLEVNMLEDYFFKEESIFFLDECIYQR